MKLERYRGYDNELERHQGYNKELEHHQGYDDEITSPKNVTKGINLRELNRESVSEVMTKSRKPRGWYSKSVTDEATEVGKND